MIIVVPDEKRVTNLAKHGIDMAEFGAAFSWGRFVVLPADPSRTGRARQIYVGTMYERVVTAVVSPLGTEALSIVSVRPASAKERRFYGGQD